MEESKLSSLMLVVKPNQLLEEMNSPGTQPYYIIVA
jgi:hypothetical protein